MITAHLIGTAPNGWLIFELREGVTVLLSLTKPVIVGMDQAQTLEYWRVRKGNGFIESDRRSAVRSAIAGVSPENIPLRLLTRAQVRKAVLKYLFNLMRQNDNERFAELPALAEHLALYTDAQVANITGWTVQQASNARAKLATLLAANGDIDHGNGEVD